MPPKAARRQAAQAQNHQQAAQHQPSQSTANASTHASNPDPATLFPYQSGLTISVHPPWPDLQFTQGELFFECTLFLYSVLALFLQYLNIYKTLWWLPKSYWHYSMKFHMINPYFLSCVGLLLGWRVTMCFWKTISELVASLSINKSQMIQSLLTIIEYAIIKTPLMTLIVSSFLFSFSRVCYDYPRDSIIYFFFPMIIYFFIFYGDLIFWYDRIKDGFLKWFHKQADITVVLERIIEPSPVQIDLESVVHMCSENPAHIRDEVQVLWEDLKYRLKRSIFAGISTAIFSVLLPCVFVPAKTPLGISQKILVDEWWEFELGLVVGLTAFSLYITYLLPLNYLDLLHRAAVHLGTWVSSDYTKPQQTGFANWCPALWMPYGLYKEDEVVQTADGRYVKAKPNPAVKGVAADPMNSAQDMFYWLCSTPCKLMNIMCVFEFCLIAAQFWMLVLTTDWQHIVTLVLLMFANYLLLAKLFKDRIILGRVYEPSPEDLALVQQLQHELRMNQRERSAMRH